MAKLNEMVKELRISVNQSAAGLALLLQITPQEYEALERDWIPPDEVLQRMCHLFSWNYQDIKRLAANTPAASSSARRAPQPASVRPAPAASPGLPSFQEMLTQARLDVGQSPEAIATLLNIGLDYYLSIEDGFVPADDILRRICTLFGWNYFQIRQMLINRSGLRLPGPPPLSLKNIQSRLPKRETPLPPLEPAPVANLAERLRHAREEIGQNPEAIALLLNLSPEHYEALEAGHPPDLELLKRIASLFKWNYNELLLLVHNEHVLQFQPSPLTRKKEGMWDAEFEQIKQDLGQAWPKLSEDQQETLLVQLRLVRDTAQRTVEAKT